ncbi:MAG: metallophosphoesterase [Elusimicrobia bacterium]|nr:metallophosphoesterase [Elusimicrobiota bacterium]
MINLQFIFFISLFVCIYLGMHYYVYFQIVTGLSLNRLISIYVRLFIYFGAISFIVSEFLTRKVISAWIKPLAYYGNVWIGIISISVTVFLIRNIFLIFVKNSRFKYFSATISLVMIAVLSLYSIFNIVREERIKEIKIKSSKLSQKFSSFNIVQLSDLHLNFIKSSRRLENIVERANLLDPDVIVITGDLIDADLCKTEELCSILKNLKAKYGVYAVTGNHEFYAGIDKFKKILLNSNIRLLQNENISLPNNVELIGIDDSESKRFDNIPIEENLIKALNTPKSVYPVRDLPRRRAGSGRFTNKDGSITSPSNSMISISQQESAVLSNGVNSKYFTLLLSHRSFIFDEASKLGIDLQLSGHTHAGQIPPMDLIVMSFLKYPYGFYKKDNSCLYTTSGTGYWGPPMRLSSHSEIVNIIIERQSK